MTYEGEMVRKRTLRLLIMEASRKVRSAQGHTFFPNPTNTR
jgi:hypothetical protein